MACGGIVFRRCCETEIADFDEGDGLNLTLEESEPSWLPCPSYNLSSSGADESRTDLDSHTDTTVLCKHCIVVLLYKTNCTVEISPFLPELGTAEKAQILLGPLPNRIAHMVK